MNCLKWQEAHSFAPVYSWSAGGAGSSASAIACAGAEDIVISAPMSTTEVRATTVPANTLRVSLHIRFPPLFLLLWRGGNDGIHPYGLQITTTSPTFVTAKSTF